LLFLLDRFLFFITMTWTRIFFVFITIIYTARALSCTTLITVQPGNIDTYATESPANNCQYSAVIFGPNGVADATFGMPIVMGSPDPNSFTIMSTNVQNIDGLTIDLMFATATGPADAINGLTVYFGQIAQSGGRYDYVMQCNLKTANETITHLGCSGYCPPSGCNAATYQCTYSTGGLVYYTVSRPSTIVGTASYARNPTLPVWLASATVQATNNAGPFDQLTLASGPCSSGGALVQQQLAPWPPLTPQSASHSQSPSRTHSHTQSASKQLNCTSYPFNAPDNMTLPFIRVAESNFTSVYTQTNSGCYDVAVVSPNNNDTRTNAYGFSPYIALAFPFETLGVDPNSADLYVYNIFVTMQAGYTPTIVPYYQSTCGRYRLASTSVSNVTEGARGSNCGFSHHSYAAQDLTFQITMNGPHKTYRDGYEQEWYQEDTLILVVKNPQPDMPLFIMSVTVALSSFLSIVHSITPFCTSHVHHWRLADAARARIRRISCRQSRSRRSQT
jgi:hypothetical protein